MSAPPDTPIVWVNGAFVDAPATTPAVTALDDGVLVGLGVFETMSIRGPSGPSEREATGPSGPSERETTGVAFARRRHLQRLHGSAGIVGIEIDTTLVEDGVDAVLSRWGSRAGRLRITATAGGAVIVSADAVVEVAATATVVVAPWPRNERSPLASAKHTAYADNVLAFAYARDLGATEALFLNTRDEVCEGSRTNIFAVCDGQLVTPPQSAGCLPGVTRALVLEYGGAVEATLDLPQLMAASEAFLTSALRGAQPIATIDGAAVGRGTRPHAQRVARVLAGLNADA
ncbi:MAG TPA: aminotransferase class IV [Acidimicrobiales bacterium]|nr:aminotransferase class IV [Acidimicrobiales bacterium]